MQVQLSHNGQEISAAIDETLAATLGIVAGIRRGRFGHVRGWRVGDGEPKCLRPALCHATGVVQPRYDRWLSRRQHAVENLSFPLWLDLVSEQEYEAIHAVSTTPTQALFEASRAKILQAREACTDGRTDCYASFTQGTNPVRCHLISETGSDRRKHPVCKDGRYEVDTIMLPLFVFHRDVLDSGSWLPVKSHAETLMGRSIERVAGVPQWRTVSLGKGNYDYLAVDGERLSVPACKAVEETPVELRQWLDYITAWAEGFVAAVEALRSQAKA